MEQGCFLSCKAAWIGETWQTNFVPEQGFDASVESQSERKYFLYYPMATEFIENLLYSADVHIYEGFLSWMCKSLTDLSVWSVVSLWFK